MPLDDQTLAGLYPRIHAFQVRLARGDRDAAEELAQETLYRILKSRDTVRDPAQLISWAFRIASRVRIDAFRSRVSSALPRELPDPRPSPDRESVSQAMALLADLTEEQREAVVLRYFEDLGYEEIASVMDAPVGTVKSYVARGLRRIRMLLEKRNDLQRR